MVGQRPKVEYYKTGLLKGRRTQKWEADDEDAEA